MKQENKKNSEFIKYFFLTRETYFGFFFLVIQQGIVAFSTLCIIKAGNRIASQQFPLFYLALFVLSLVIVYVPGIVSSIYLQKGMYVLIHRVVSRYLEIFSGKATLSSNAEYRQENEPWLIGSGASVLWEVYSLFFSWSSAVLNVFLNVLIIGFELSTQIIFAYLGSLFLLFLFSQMNVKKIDVASSECQKKRNKLNQLFLSAWDNIYISNTYNLQSWKKMFFASCNEAKKASVKYSFLTHITSAFTMVAALVPIILISAYYFYINHNNFVALAGLVVTFPRQIQIIQTVFDLFSHSIEWQGIRARLRDFISSLKLPDFSEVRTKIQWDKLSFSYENHVEKLHSINECIDLINSLSHGKITLRGPNGAGKSILLSCLKEKMQEKVFYLPVNSQLIFNNSFGKNLSQGEKMLNIINELDGVVKDKTILFLDEWDANLDSKNIEMISKKIDEFSKHVVVLEIRHRFD